MRRFSFSRLCQGLIAVMASACLTLFSATACATGKTGTEKKIVIAEDLTHPSFKTLTVGSCPNDHAGKRKEEEEEWKTNTDRCSRARLVYPYYKKIPWMNQLIARSIILPMFAERLDEKPVKEGGESLYKSKLISLIQKGGEHGSVEKPPPIDFNAKLTGYEQSSLSPAREPRPELFGPYLQFVFSHELKQQYDARPKGPLGGFVVVDTRTRKIVTFDDLILPGQEKTLKTLQQATFRAWLRTERNLPAEAIRAHFANPSYAFFNLNKNWRIAEGGLVFRFAPNEVGPRPFGSPEIFVEKDRLRGIIQPDILEEIPGRELTVGN